MPDASANQITARADSLQLALRKQPTDADIADARALLQGLRDVRQFGTLVDLAELLARYRPDDATVRRLYAQGLIECGRLSAATQVLEETLRWPNIPAKEYTELQGLRGRAYKQLFVDTADPTGALQERFLRAAVKAYGAAFEANSALYWHGVNLCALARAAQRLKIALPGPSSAEYAQLVLSSLANVAEKDRDEWWHATKAEAYLALDDLPAAETHLSLYIHAPDVQPFHIASTLRQLREIWAIQTSSEAGARLLQILEAYLASQPGANFTLDPKHLVAMKSLQSEDEEQLQRIAGPEGRKNLRWYRTGLQRASCVAAVCERLGTPFGTGFAVRAGDFGIEPPETALLLTNWHVLNSQGLYGRTDFSNVEILFEAITETPQTSAVRSVVAESPAIGGLDYSLLLLQQRIEGLQLMPLAKSIANRQAIAAKTSEARVYIIGYPFAQGLQFSIQDNLLIDHECPPGANPPDLKRLRVQYTTATEKGSSGSPVMDSFWDCISLHHAGAERGERGIAPLNQGLVCIEANEGIWIQSVQNDVRAKKIKLD